MATELPWTTTPLQMDDRCAAMEPGASMETQHVDQLMPLKMNRPDPCVKPRGKRRVSDRSTGETLFMDAAAGEKLGEATKRCENIAREICDHISSGDPACPACRQQLDAICQQLRDHYSVRTALVSIVTLGGLRFIAGSGIDLDQIGGCALNPVAGGLNFGHFVCQRQAPIIVLDTSQNERHNQHPLVTGEPHMMFYAGQPITVCHPEGLTFIGTLCIMDDKPRDGFLSGECALLEQLSEQVTATITSGIPTLLDT